MAMTKREKILLQILLGVLVVGLIVVYLLLPQLKQKKILLNTKEEDEATLEEMNEALQQMDVYEELSSAEERIEKINIFFNGIWNSYTVDGFINQLVADNHLEIKSLAIGNFQTVSDEAFGVSVPFEEVEDVEENEDEYASQVIEDDILLSCDVSISAFGKYEDVLALMDQLNEESEAMAIISANYTKEYDYLLGEIDDVYGNCSITFKIYGIKPYEKKEVKVDDEQ